MTRSSFSVMCLAFSSILCTGIAALLESKKSKQYAVETIFCEDIQPANQPRIATPPATSDLRKSGDSKSRSEVQISARLDCQRTVTDPTQPPPKNTRSAVIPTQPTPYLNFESNAKTHRDIGEMWVAARNYSGPSRHGVSSYSMRRNFEKKLVQQVYSRFQRSRGGTIEEFGALDIGLLHHCAEIPSLKLSDVRHLARESFGIPDFQISYPPCTGVAFKTSCSYETGKCCTRPQTEFVARYYDTAVSAMALGATREEAFAPLVHARVLAHTLQSCDPINNPVGASTRWGYLGRQLNFKIPYRSGSSVFYTPWLITKFSFISFPVAYEVLYEVYNTMLIERVRSRGAVRLPTDRQMKLLSDAVYYKKAMARMAPICVKLNPDAMFPSSRDFRVAGLDMAISRMAEPSEPTAEDPSDADLHPSLRFSNSRIRVYETSSRAWLWLDYSTCNWDEKGSPYYPYIFQQNVESRWQGCCAKECRFMEQYGGTFSEGSVNCCSGCNRYSCSANSFHAAKSLAKISAVETSSKHNVGAEEIAITI